MKQNFKRVLIGAPVLSLMFYLVACGTSADSDKKADDRVLVKTEKVKFELIEQREQFTGNVEPFEKAYISPAIPARITKIYKEVGDVVRKDELLAQMDLSNYRQAKAQLEILEREYERLDTLFKVGSVSQQQMDRISTELEVAKVTFENLQENTELRSPVSGIVTGRFFENGEMYSGAPVVDNRAAILTVEQIDPAKVTVSVAEQYFPHVGAKLNISMTLDVYPDKLFDGSVHLKYPTIDPLTRTFMLELKFPNKEQFIRPGMFGRVNIGFGEIERAIISDLAVLRQQGTNERYVFVIENNIAVRKTVEIGRRIGDCFEIINGLSVGEEVVVAGHARLLDGIEVRYE